MTTPIKNNQNTEFNNNKPVGSSFKDQVSYFTGRIWKWLTTSVPNFFKTDIPAFFQYLMGKSKLVNTALKDKDIQPKHIPPSVEVQAVVKNTLNPRIPPTSSAAATHPLEVPLPPPPNLPESTTDEEEDEPEIRDLPEIGDLPEIRDLNADFEHKGMGREETPLAEHPQPTPFVAEAPFLPAEEVPPRPPKTLTSTVKGVVVMDQRILPNGHNHCGFHAFKNAILGLSSSDPIRKLLTDQQFFEDWHAYTSGGLERLDISAVELLKAAEKLKKDDPLTLTSNLKILREEFLKNSNRITLLKTNPDKQTLSDAQELDELRSLYAISQKQGPFSHSFVIGRDTNEGEDNGHWVALVLNKDGQGNRSWEGFNSYPIPNTVGQSATEVLEEQVKILERVLENPEPEIARILEELNQKTFKMKETLNNNGTLKDPSSTNLLLLRKGLAETSAEMTKMHDFLTKTGLINSNIPEIQKIKETMLAVRSFHQRNALVTEQTVPTYIRPLVNEILSGRIVNDKESCEEALAAFFADKPDSLVLTAIDLLNPPKPNEVKIPNKKRDNRNYLLGVFTTMLSQTPNFKPFIGKLLEYYMERELINFDLPLNQADSNRLRAHFNIFLAESTPEARSTRLNLQPTPVSISSSSSSQSPDRLEIELDRGINDQLKPKLRDYDLQHLREDIIAIYEETDASTVQNTIRQLNPNVAIPNGKTKDYYLGTLNVELNKMKDVSALIPSLKQALMIYGKSTVSSRRRGTTFDSLINGLPLLNLNNWLKRN